jgi:Membrane proteins related to metalloendopeptidases
MSVCNTPPKKPPAITSQKSSFSRRWRLALLYPLILCLAASIGYYHQPSTTYATAPDTQAATPAAGQAQENKLAKVATTPSLWPVTGRITSGFGWRISPFGDGNELHPGIDIATNMGCPVVATADGQVVASGWSGGYGNMVQIDHGNGLETIYGHNSQLAVGVGQTVRKGQVISYAGSTGKSTGPHVHYEIRKDGAAIDPWKYLVAY